MIPILYPKEETSFLNNGLGPLSEAINCTVTEELNGEYFLTMTYPADGVRFRELDINTIIFAVPAYGKNPQPFRVTERTKTMDGRVEIYAPHVSDELNYVITKRFEVSPSGDGKLYATTLMSNFQAQAITTAAFPMRFRFEADATLTAEKKYICETPRSIRSQLGRSEESALRFFGGELEWDRWTVRLKEARGADNGVQIEYGKNLTDISMEISMTETRTGVVPFWYKAATETEPEKFVSLLDDVIYSSFASNYPFQMAVPLDMTSIIPEDLILPGGVPNRTLLSAMAQNWMGANLSGTPATSADVRFVPLWQTQEYAGVIPEQTVGLGDMVSVLHGPLGIVSKAKVTKTIYNVLLDRYDGIELGDPRATLTKIVTERGVNVVV